jgi:hypothetical protein
MSVEVEAALSTASTSSPMKVMLARVVSALPLSSLMAWPPVLSTQAVSLSVADAFDKT